MKYIALLVITVLAFGCNHKTSSETSATIGSKVEAFDVQNGQFFLYVDGYHCNLNGKMVLSYKDSIYFQDNNVCQTGDVCTNDSKCVDTAMVEDLSIQGDNLKVTAFGGDYLYGKDISENGGVPDASAERQIASVEGFSDTSKPSRKVLIYFMWCIAFGMLFYMHAPEY